MFFLKTLNLTTLILEIRDKSDIAMQFRQRQPTDYSILQHVVIGQRKI